MPRRGERVALTILADGSRVKLLISGSKIPTAAGLVAPAPPPPQAIPGALVNLTVTSNGSGVVLDIQRCASSFVDVVIEPIGGVVKLDILRSTTSVSQGVGALSNVNSPVTDTKVATEVVQALVSQEPSAMQARLGSLARSIELTSARFWRVPFDYYDRELEWRRDVLGAASTKQVRFWPRHCPCATLVALHAMAESRLVRSSCASR